MRIRDLRTQDLAECAEIVGRSPFYRSWGLDGARALTLLQGALGDGTSALRAAEDGAVLGFSWVLPRGGFGRSAYLRLLVVDEAQARSGVGRALMADLEAAWLPDRDVLLLCTATNLRARAFYEALGYTLIGELDDYVQIGASECLYRKRRGGPSGAGGPAASSV